MSATRYRSQLSGDWEQRCKGRTLVNPELAERFFLKTEYRFNPMTRSVEELLRHILLHVLPAGFVRIGHFWKPLAAVQNRLRPRSREVKVDATAETLCRKLADEGRAVCERR